MSTEAVTWAMDRAPMPRTEKGKPDTTARHVLQVLAEHASPNGTDAHPSVLRIQYRTGYDRTTVQRALRRLEKAGLIAKDGTREGRTRYKLALELRRPETDWSDLEREEDEFRAAAAERKRRSRAKTVTHSESVTVTDAEGVTVTDGKSVTSDVTHSESVRHALKVRSSRTQRRPNHQQPSVDSQPASAALFADPDASGGQHEAEGPGFESDFGIPAAARPLVDELTTAGVIVRWPYKGNEWFPLLALISKSGAPAMVSHAKKAYAKARGDVETANYFFKGWGELPPLPPPRQPSRREQQMPPYCGDPDCDEKTRLRQHEDDNGLRSLYPCPDCHPKSRKDSAA